MDKTKGLDSDDRIFTTYYKGGQREFECRYVNDKLEGKVSKWDQSGNKIL